MNADQAPNGGLRGHRVAFVRCPRQSEEAGSAGDAEEALLAAARYTRSLTGLYWVLVDKPPLL